MNTSRRHFIKAGDATLALPFLPSIAASAKRSKPSKKFVYMYIPNGINRRGFFPGEEQAELPGFQGGFNANKVKAKRTINKPGSYKLELTKTMQPLKGLEKDITLITGMDRSFMNGQDVHAQGSSCFMSSVSPEQAAAKAYSIPQGRSLDHIIGDKIGYDTAFRTLEISCNGFSKPKEPLQFDNISWYGYNKVAPSIKDPKKLFNRLFRIGNFGSHVNDVSDLILADAKSLSRNLGREDKQKFGQFTSMIRSIEVRIARLEGLLKNHDIKEPGDEILPRGEYIRLMGDLMISALQMGLTNVCTFMIGPERWNAPMLYEGVFDEPVIHHSFTHNQKGDGYLDVQKIDAFHMQQYAYVISRMKATKEVDGSSLLDNTVLCYGAGLADGATHQYFDLPLIVAGKAQGQIKQGRFLKLKSGTPHTNMWLTIANLMGLNLESFADSTGSISLG
jgi:hypothetical protein